MSLANKVAVITGGGSGIGADAARGFLEAGAQVVLNGRREDVLRRTAARLDSSGRRIAVVPGDIGQPDTCRRLIDTAVERFDGVDVLFNNAGIFSPKPFLEVSPRELDGYFNLMRGYFVATQAAVAQMQSRGGGAVISIGSIWALMGIADTPSAAPSMAKGGVHSLTRELAIEFAPKKIRFNAIAPGVVETPLFDPLLSPEQLASFNSFHPLGRNGQVKDITQALLFLADEERSGWMTGVVLPVDGGVTAGRN